MAEGVPSLKTYEAKSGALKLRGLRNRRNGVGSKRKEGGLERL